MNIIYRSCLCEHGFVARLAVFLLMATSSMTVVAGTAVSADKAPSATSSEQDAAQFARGAKEWQLVCGACHNLRSPSELSNADWDVAMGQMRVRAGLTGAQARDILAFLKASNNKAVLLAPLSPDAVTATLDETPKATASEASSNPLAAGSAIFHQTCIACHGADGKGAVPGAPDFTDPNGVLSKSDQVLEGFIKNGEHTPGVAIAMPPNGGNANLNDEDIKSVIFYLRHAFGKQ